MRDEEYRRNDALISSSCAQLVIVLTILRWLLRDYDTDTVFLGLPPTSSVAAAVTDVNGGSTPSSHY